MYLTIQNLTCVYVTNIKFGHYILLTQHYFWMKF